MIQSEEKYYSEWELVLIKENEMHNECYYGRAGSYDAAAKNLRVKHVQSAYICRKAILTASAPVGPMAVN